MASGRERKHRPGDPRDEATAAEYFSRAQLSFSTPPPSRSRSHSLPLFPHTSTSAPELKHRAEKKDKDKKGEESHLDSQSVGQPSLHLKLSGKGRSKKSKPSGSPRGESEVSPRALVQASSPRSASSQSSPRITGTTLEMLGVVMRARGASGEFPDDFSHAALSETTANFMRLAGDLAKAKKPEHVSEDALARYMPAKDAKGKYSVIAVKTEEGWQPYLIGTISMWNEEEERGETLIGKGESKVVPAYQLFTGEKVAVKVFKKNRRAELIQGEIEALKIKKYFKGFVEALDPFDDGTESFEVDAGIFKMDGMKEITQKHIKIKMVLQKFHPGSDGVLFFYDVDKSKDDSDSTYFKAKKNLAPSVVMQAMFEFLEAVSENDDQGLVHRDLKLENVLFGTYLKAKLCDFGSALLRSKIHGGESMAGSFGYMAPEADKSKADEFVLFSSPQGESIEIKDIEVISRKYDGKPKPVIISQFGEITLYGCVNQAWRLTTLDEEGRKAFEHVIFPEISDTRLFTQKDFTRQIRMEITHKQRHVDARGTVFTEVDKYSAGAVALEMLTTENLKAKLIEKKAKIKSENNGDKELSRDELFALMPDLFPLAADATDNLDAPEVLNKLFDSEYDRFVAKHDASNPSFAEMLPRFVEDFIYEKLVKAKLLAVIMRLMEMKAEERCSFAEAKDEVTALRDKFSEKVQEFRMYADRKNRSRSVSTEASDHKTARVDLKKSLSPRGPGSGHHRFMRGALPSPPPSPSSSRIHLSSSPPPSSSSSPPPSPSSKSVELEPTHRVLRAGSMSSTKQ